MQDRETPLRGRRPLPYNSIAADKICTLLAEGKSLRSILRDNPELPNREVIMRWQRQNAKFALQYARSIDAQAEVYADEIIDIADESQHATVRHEVDSARLRVDSRKWIACKLKPRKYGDQLNILNINQVQSDLRATVDVLCEIARKYVSKTSYMEFLTDASAAVERFVGGPHV